MHPILFELPGGFPVRSFSVMVALGFLLGSWIFSRLVARTSDDPARDVQRYGAIPVWVLVGAFGGARVAYVLVEIVKGSNIGHGFLSAPWTVLMVWTGGLVMYGGLFGGMLAGAWCTRRHGIPTAHAMDLGLTAGFFGQAVGRIGCLLVGDDYGSVVPERWRHLPFPITLRVPEVLQPHSLFDEENRGALLWATQPWMTANALLIGCLGLWMLKRRRYPGQVSLVIVLCYSITRFGIENFRGDSVRGLWYGGLSTSQLISIAAGLTALGLLVAQRGRQGGLEPRREAS